MHQISTSSREIESETEDLNHLSLQDIEKRHIQRVLAVTNGHKGKSCDILGISRPRLRRLIKQYNLTNNSSECEHEDN